jgi:hypothetical protein
MNDYHILPLEEWLSAILAPFVLYRLCVGLREVPEWTFETARETVDFEFYLDQILDRLKGIWADNPLAYTLNSDNLYALLPQIFENVKESFIAARDGFCESSDGLRGHQDLGASQQGPTASCSHARRTPREQRVRCPATTGLPTDTSPNFWSTPRDMTAPSDGLGFEIQDLENDKFWIDLMSDEFMMKTPYNF